MMPHIYQIPLLPSKNRASGDVHSETILVPHGSCMVVDAETVSR